MRLTALAAALRLFRDGRRMRRWLAGKEIAFSEADVQAQIDKNNALQKPLANGLLVIRLSETPGRLGTPADKATICPPGHRPARPDADPGRLHRHRRHPLRRRTESLFLADPVADSVQSAALHHHHTKPPRGPSAGPWPPIFAAGRFMCCARTARCRKKTAWLLR